MNLQEMVNNKDSEFNDDSSQSMSTENINRPISFKIVEGSCSNNEEIESDIQHRKWMKVGTERPCFTFIGKPGLKVKIQNSEKPLECFEPFIIREITELRETD